MTVLRQSTQIIVTIGPAVAVGDGFTPVTTLDLSTADEAELLKANTTTTTSIAAATFAAITGCDGWYGLTLTTSLTDTVGPLTVMVNDDSLILPIFARFQVIEEAAYDAIYAAAAPGPATPTNITAGTITTATNVTTLNGIAANVITATSINADAITAAKIADGAIDAATFAAGAITATVIATGAIDADALAADAVAEIADGVWDEDATAHQTQGTFGQAIGDPGADTDTIWALANTNLDAAVSSRMATYTQPTGFLAATFPAGTIANTTNITAGTVTTATNVTTVNGLAANVITAASMAADASVEIAAAVWDEDATGHQTQGTFGQAIGDPVADTNTIFKAVVTDATGATVGVDVVAIKAETVNILADTDVIGAAGVGLTAVALADATSDGVIADAVWNAATATYGAVGSYGLLVETDLDATISSRLATAGYTTPPTVGAIADQVWDEALAGHLGVGSTGEALDAAGDPWSTALPGAYGAGTAGKIIGDNINAPIGTVDTVVDAIKVQTDKMIFTVANQIDSNVQYVNNIQVTGDGQPGTEWGPV